MASADETGEQRSSRATVIAAVALGLVWLGDALIYVVLPLYPAAFGVELALVGVLLAVNRIVRILGYGWVAPLARRFGLNALVAVACAAAALSTLAYGIATGFFILLIARILWGASYGVLYLASLSYAYGDGQGAGRRMGLSRAVSTVGPVAALGLGGYLVTVAGPQQVFVIYGLIGLLAIPLALKLPALAEAVDESSARAPHRWRPAPLNILFFVIALAADGVFTATLSILLAEIVSTSTAVIGAGLLLAFHRTVVIVLSLTSGPLIDRIEPQRLLVPAGVVVAAGLATIAAGYIYAGALVLILSRAVFGVLGPVLAAQRAPGDRINALASYATWSDTGLALGPLIGTLAVTAIGFSATYALLSATVAAALAATVLIDRSVRAAP